ncbi:MAG TPA: hypothetical protein VNR51_04305 [Hyphomicrobium sp.]|nr:hypothetical protein [Hyphomicrobium sp.]
MLRIACFAAVLLISILPAIGACFPDWSIAAPIVHAEKLATVETLSSIAARQIPGIIVKTTLCEDDGVFVYRIVVREADGKLTNRTVDARSPFGR